MSDPATSLALGIACLAYGEHLYGWRRAIWIAAGYAGLAAWALLTLRRWVGTPA